MKKEELLVTSGVKSGEDLVVTKWIGLEGTSIAAKEREAVLLERFAPAFVETAKQFDQYLSVFRKQKSQKNGALLPCTILQKAVYSEPYGKWEAALAWDWILT